MFDPWPYRSWMNYAMDGLYALMVFYLFYNETKEMLPAIKVRSQLRNLFFLFRKFLLVQIIMAYKT